MKDQAALPRVTVAAVVPRAGRYLLVEEHIDGRAVFNQPAGHLDPDESLIEAVVRETLEETGWHVRPVGLIGIYQLFRPGVQFVRLSFLCEALSHDATRPLDDGIVAAHWLSRAELLDSAIPQRSSLVLRCIDDHLAGRLYPLAQLADPQW